MDKNTINGLIMMVLVVLLFMWLQKPSEKQQQEQAAEAAELAAQEAASDVDAANVLTVDSVSPAEIETVRNTVKQYGVRDTMAGANVYRLVNGPLNIALNGADNQLSGSVSVDSVTVPVAAILSSNYGDIRPATAKKAVAELKNGLLNLAKYESFARYISGDSTVVTLKNDVLKLDISNKGAQIARATLLDPRYTSYDSVAVELLSPEYGGYYFTINSPTRRFETRDFYFTPVAVSDTTVTMQLELGDGITWGIRYTLAGGNNYTVKMDIVQMGVEKLTNVFPQNMSSIDFCWTQKMPRNEAGRMFEERNSAIYYRFKSGGVKNLSEGSDDDKNVDERLRWIGYKNQFFSAVLIANEEFSSASLKSVVLKDNEDYIKDLSTEAVIPYDRSKAEPASFTFFLGPNLYPLLNDLEDNIVPETDLQLTKLIPLGWSMFRWINTLIIIPLFTFLGKFISSYGLIILLLTIFIKIILFPFTYKSYMSQARMRVLAPEIKEINEKYPGQENAMKRQQEQMALYSRAGANPMSGCLPMLLQMPILIAMFNFFPSAIELRGQSFLWAHDLSAPDALIPLPFNIPMLGNHLSIFCLLMTATNVLYSYYNMQSQPGGNSMPGMKWMTILMPLMFLVFFNNYAAGLSYYYFLSLLITIVQMWIFRKVVSEDKVRAIMAENAKKPKKKKSGFMARLEEAQRQQQAMLREQEKRRGKKR